jgi:hypothetical protein
MFDQILSLFIKNREDFKLPEFKQIPPVVLKNPYFNKYNIVPKELYNVTKYFEKPAEKLDVKQRYLRKKYLLIFLNIIDRELPTVSSINPIASQLIKSNKDNFNNLIELIKRIIKLMINEVDTVNKSNGDTNNYLYICVIILIVIIYYHYVKTK